MIRSIYNDIKFKEDEIEEKRLNIKKIKNEKSRIHDLMDIIGSIYEYVAAPMCAISISLAALFTGAIVYALPIAMAVGAISIVSYKFVLRNKLDLLNKRMSSLKEERQQLYDEREQLYEKIFDKLQHQNLDKKDYYHQIIDAEQCCQDLTSSMKPYKKEKEKYLKARNIVSRIFDYGLAPITTVVVPLVCALTGMGPLGQVISMSVSGGLILGCATANDKLTKKVERLDSTIQDIKSDRTVKYIERDLKMKESLEYLNNEYFKMMDKSKMLYNKRKEELNTRTNTKENKPSKTKNK